MLLTKEERKRIENTIAEAEKKTSGEIVCVVLKTSGSYVWIPWFCAGVGLAVPSVWVGIISAIDWEFTALHLLEWQCLGLSLGLLFSLVPWIRRLLVRPRSMKRRVHREALATFTAAGVSQTRDRTGILIYVSEFERRVEILADEGIHKHTGPTYWDSQIKGIVQGIRDGKAADALCEAVAQMGSKLSEHFPPRIDDTNELPNRVRTDGPTED